MHLVSCLSHLVNGYEAVIDSLLICIGQRKHGAFDILMQIEVSAWNCQPTAILGTDKANA